MDWSTAPQETPALTRAVPHKGDTSAVAFSDVGGRTLLVTAGAEDARVRLWDPRDWSKAGRALAGHARGVTAMTVGELDGTPVALTGGFDETAKLWDLTSRKAIGLPMAGHDFCVSAVALTRLDGEPIAITGDTQGVRLWSVPGCEQIGDLLVSQAGEVNSLAVAEMADRRVVLAGCNEGVTIWDLGARQLVGELAAGHHVNTVTAATIDGRLVAVTAEGSYHTWPQMWDVTTGTALGEPLAAKANRGGSAAMMTELGGQPVLVEGGSYCVRLWDARTREQIGELGPQDVSGEVWSLARTDIDGEPVIAIASNAEYVWLWRPTAAQSASPPRRGGHDAAITSVVISEHAGRGVGVTAGKDGTVRLWDLATGERIGEPLGGHDGAVTSAVGAVLDGHPAIVTGGADGTLRRWDIGTGTPPAPVVVASPGTQVQALAVTSIEGRSAAVVALQMDNLVRTFDLATGEPIGDPSGQDEDNAGHSDFVMSVAVTSLGDQPTAITAGLGSSVLIWDLARLQLIRELDIDQELWALDEDNPDYCVYGIATTVLDGTPVAVTGSDGGSVCVWDLTTGTRSGPPLLGHTHVVWAAAIAETGGRLLAVTGGEDGTVRTWDLRTRGPAGPELTFPDPVHALAASGDRLLVCHGRDITAYTRRR
jgi:WD40 repeat protein